MKGFIPKEFQGHDWKEMSFTTLFQGPVVVEKKVIAVLGFPYHWVHCEESRWNPKMPTNKR